MRYIEDRPTAAVLSGDPDAERHVRLSWTLTLEAYPPLSASYASRPPVVAHTAPARLLPEPLAKHNSVRMVTAPNVAPHAAAAPQPQS